MKTIRQLRQERGWSQAKLATRLGMVPRTVSTWERGVRTPEPRTLVRLAELFSISPTAIAPESRLAAFRELFAERPRD